MDQESHPHEDAQVPAAGTVNPSALDNFIPGRKFKRPIFIGAEGHVTLEIMKFLNHQPDAKSPIPPEDDTYAIIPLMSHAGGDAQQVFTKLHEGFMFNQLNEQERRAWKEAQAKKELDADTTNMAENVLRIFHNYGQHYLLHEDTDKASYAFKQSEFKSVLHQGGKPLSNKQAQDIINFLLIKGYLHESAATLRQPRHEKVYVLAPDEETQILLLDEQLKAIEAQHAEDKARIKEIKQAKRGLQKQIKTRKPNEHTSTPTAADVSAPSDAANSGENSGHSTEE